MQCLKGRAAIVTGGCSGVGKAIAGRLVSTPNLWKKLIEINLYGPLNMHYAVLPGMVEPRRGRIASFITGQTINLSGGLTMHG